MRSTEGFRRACAAFLVPLSCAFWIGCATPSGGPKGVDAAGKPARPISAKEAAEYQAIRTVYETGKYEDAIKKIRVFETRYPKSAQIPLVMNLHGMAHLLSKHPERAIPKFQMAIETAADPVFRSFVRYNLASAQFETGALHEADGTLHLLQPELLDDEGRIKVAVLRAQVLMKQGRTEDAIRVVLNHGHLAAGSPERLALLAAQVDAGLAVLQDQAALERVVPDADGSPLADRVWFAYAGRLIQSGKADQAETWLSKIVGQFPTSPHFAEAQELVRNINDQTVVNGKAVGVLLPLSGKYAAFGKRSLQAIAMAYHLYGPQKAGESDGGISLVVEDSGDTPEQAVRALETLCNEHRVIAVLGPLVSKGVELVSRRATELRMPLISLAQQQAAASAMGGSGEYVFNAGLTPKAQATEVARFAVEKLGLARFAILHSEDTFGRKYADSFWDSVEALGGRVTAVESYAAGETDFRNAVDRMTGLNDMGGRQRELDEMAKLREEAKITKKTRKTEKFYNLKPVIDFDAVFIPEDPKAIGQILPTFSYRDADKVRFLGISAWHSPELLTRAQGFAEGAVFVDAFHAEGSDPQTQAFVSRYKALPGDSPEPSAIDAIAFDAGAMVRAVLAAEEVHSRARFVERLRAMPPFNGVTGRIAFADGDLTRKFRILTVKKGRIEEER